MRFWPGILVYYGSLVQISRLRCNVILIAMSSDVKKEDINRFLVQQKHQNLPDNFYITLDQSNMTGQVFKTYKLPETLIIDNKKQVRHKFIGANWTFEQARMIIDQL